MSNVSFYCNKPVIAPYLLQYNLPEEFLSEVSMSGKIYEKSLLCFPIVRNPFLGSFYRHYFRGNDKLNYKCS